MNRKMMTLTHFKLYTVDIKFFFETYLLTYLNKDIYTKSVKSYKYFNKYISLV